MSLKYEPALEPAGVHSSGLIMLTSTLEHTYPAHGVYEAAVEVGQFARYRE